MPSSLECSSTGRATISTRPLAKESRLRKEGGELEELIGLLGGGLLGIYREGQPQLLPHGDQLIRVLRVADPGDGVLDAQLFGGEAGQQVELVPAGGGDEHLRLFHAGLPEGGHGGAVAHHGHDVKLLGALGKHLGVGVDDGDVVALAGELRGQGGAHFAVAHDNNVHILPPFA